MGLRWWFRLGRRLGFGLYGWFVGEDLLPRVVAKFLGSCLGVARPHFRFVDGHFLHHDSVAQVFNLDLIELDILSWLGGLLTASIIRAGLLAGALRERAPVSIPMMLNCR